MESYQQDVEAFMSEMGQPFGRHDSDTFILREKLIREETYETIDAISARDMIETIDGVCDCLYVGFGAAAAFGFRVSDYFISPYPEGRDGIVAPSFVATDESTALLAAAKETVSWAFDREDVNAAIPALVGYLSAAFAVADRFGIVLRPFWEEVHRSNMAKVGGPIREDGKRLKPPGWTPPDLRKVYLRVYGHVPSRGKTPMVMGDAS